MKCEIVNPSDLCYITGDDLEVLAAVCNLLGGGWYGLKCDDKIVVPMTMFVDLDEWWKETFGRTSKEFVDSPGASLKMAEVMDTFEYPDKRSSMNNIGARAKAWSKQLKDEVIPK